MRARHGVTVQWILIMFLYISVSRVIVISQSTSLLGLRACLVKYRAFIDLALRSDASSRNVYRVFSGM